MGKENIVRFDNCIPTILSVKVSVTVSATVSVTGSARVSVTARVKVSVKVSVTVPEIFSKALLLKTKNLLIGTQHDPVSQSSLVSQLLYK